MENKRQKVVLFAMYFSEDFKYMENGFAEQFLRMGYDLTIVTSTRLYPKNYTKILRDKNIEETRPAGEAMEGPYKVVRLSLKEYGRNGGYVTMPGFTGLLKRIQPDIVLFQSLELFTIGVFAALARITSKFDFYIVVNKRFDTLSDQPEQSSGFSFREALKDALMRNCQRFCLWAADRVLPMNEFNIDYACSVYSQAKQKLVPITLGVDADKIYLKPDQRTKIRDEYGIKNDETLIISTGKIAPYKATHVIVEALASIGRSDVKLMLVGKANEDYRQRLTDIAINAGIQDQVYFIPWVPSDELHHYFSAADVAVWGGSATISTIEASAVGLPVIIPEYHGYEHRIKNENGYFVKPANTTDLTHKLNQLLSNKSNITEMGKRGRELVEKELNWNSIVQKILV